jgi:hypothetical protein
MAATAIRIVRRTVTAPLGESPKDFCIAHDDDERVVHVEMKSIGVPARRRTTMDWYITAYLARSA